MALTKPDPSKIDKRSDPYGWQRDTATAQAGHWDRAHATQPGLFEATVSSPSGPPVTTTDRNEYLMLAATFVRADTVVDYRLARNVRRIETSGGPKPYTLPWRHWKAQNKATRRGTTCTKLNDEERAWLDVQVTWTCREYVGEQYEIVRHTGRVWSLHPKRGMVWVWTGDAFRETYIEILTKTEE